MTRANLPNTLLTYLTHFIAVQIKWSVSIWNETLDWTGFIDQCSIHTALDCTAIQYTDFLYEWNIGFKWDITFHFVGNKAKRRISKWVFQENKARQIFRKNEHFLSPDTFYLLFQTTLTIKVIHFYKSMKTEDSITLRKKLFLIPFECKCFISLWNKVY